MNMIHSNDYSNNQKSSKPNSPVLELEKIKFAVKNFIMEGTFTKFLQETDQTIFSCDYISSFFCDSACHYCRISDAENINILIFQLNEYIKKGYVFLHESKKKHKRKLGVKTIFEIDRFTSSIANMVGCYKDSLFSDENYRNLYLYSLNLDFISQWSTFPPIQLCSITADHKNRSCIYFIVANHVQCLYVGQTKNLENRLLTHHRLPTINEVKSLGIPVHIYYIDCPEMFLYKEEKKWIKRLNPPWNLCN